MVVTDLVSSGIIGIQVGVGMAVSTITAVSISQVVGGHLSVPGMSTGRRRVAMALIARRAGADAKGVATRVIVRRVTAHAIGTELIWCARVVTSTGVCGVVVA